MRPRQILRPHSVRPARVIAHLSAAVARQQGDAKQDARGFVLGARVVCRPNL